MGSKKDIGKAYREELEGYSSSPHNRVWENIEAELKKSKRRVFPIWKILTGLGIILLISSIGVFSYYQTTNSVTNTTDIEQSQQDIIYGDTLDNKTINNVTNTPIKNTQPHTNTGNETKSSVTDRETNLNKNKDTSVSNVKPNRSQNTYSKTTTSKTNTTSKSTDNINGIALKNTKSVTVLNTTKLNKSKTPNQTETHNSLTKNNTTSQPNNELNSENSINSINNSSINSESNAINDAYLADKNKTKDSLQLEINEEPIELDIKDLIETEKTKNAEKPEKQSYSLAISTYVSPTYTNTLGNDSSIDSRLDNNKVAGRININYGVAATVKISEKSSLRFGIGASQLSYIIKGADTTLTAENGGFLSNASGYSNLTVNSQASNSIPNVFNPNSVIDFQQKIKYLETPLDYIYHLKDDSRINIDLIGGFSTLFLTDQSIIAKDRNGNNIEIGEVENLKKTNFSFNLGSHFSYPLSDKLNINLEPNFKYYLSTYSNNINTKPYSFSLRFGITYRF